MATTPSLANLTYQASKSDNGISIIIVGGTFEKGDSVAAFRSMVQASGATAVSFNSGGGSISKALALGREIRTLGLSTVQPRALECASACAFAFMGGVKRFAEPGAIGVHKSSFAPDSNFDVNSAVSAVQEATADIVTYMIEMGVKPAVLQLSLKIEANDMRYLSGREMEEFGVTHSEPSLPRKFPTAKVPPAPTLPPAPASKPSFSVPAHVLGTQTSILYEEGEEANGSGTAWEGEVIWAVEQETDLDGRKRSILTASIYIPRRNVSVDIRIKPNDDKSLPASHLVEIKYDFPPDFPAGNVRSVPGLVMKPTEEARGDALLGVSTQVTPGYFWIALSSIAGERQRNMGLLREHGWIDVPMLFDNGKRGILTLEKGPAGTKAVDTAVAAWQAG